MVQSNRGLHAAQNGTLVYVNVYNTNANPIASVRSAI